MAHQAASKSAPKTLQSLQLLRALAALAVVIVHVGTAMYYRFGVWHLPGITRAGTIGVDVFFCLSGFIMYYTSGTEFGVRGKWRLFLWRRFLRIYPIYWVVTIATLLVCQVPGSHMTSTGFSSSDLVKSFLLLPQGNPPVITQGWTLVHEVRFYLVFGVLLLFPRGPALRILTAWGVMSFGVLVVSYVDQPLLDSGPLARAVTFLFHPHSIQFVFGVLAAYTVRQWRTPKWVDQMILPVGLFSTAVVMYCFSELRPGVKYYGITLFTIPTFLLVLGAALAERRWQPRIPAAGVKLGDASYSTYLIHNLIAIPVVWNLFPATSNTLSLSACAYGLVALIHAAGLLIHITTERPLHRLSRRLIQRSDPRSGEPVGRDMSYPTSVATTDRPLI